MLGRPGMSWPAALAALGRRLLKRPSSPRVWSCMRSWRMVGLVDLAVALGQLDRGACTPAPNMPPPLAAARRRRARRRSRRPACSRSPATVPGVAAPAAAWPPPAPRPARSYMRVVLATAQPLLRPPMRSLSGTRASSRNTSLNMAWPVISPSGRIVDAGLVHVDGEVGDALVLGHVGVGAGDEHAEVGDLAARGPHLLTVDDPLVAVAARPCVETGEVGAGAGLAEELAPRLLAGDDVAHVPVDLLLRCRGWRWSGAASSRPRPPGAPSAPNSAMAFCTATPSLRSRPLP